MSEDAQRRTGKRKRLWMVLTVVAALLAVLIIPPMVSISRYKSGITRLISASLGRPVRLSSVEARLLPRPGFVLTDLTVEEDPTYGAEPILHANTVTASIRLLSLWRGRLEIDRISVDEASLNLVHNSSGHWNLDALFHQAGVRKDAKARRALPYLQATNSRINLKEGLEKLPFSLTDAEISFWQANPGDWRIRLRAQPVRTDLNLQAGDTGTLRLEGSLKDAPQLRLMPLHLYAEWKEAQLGQLSRLVAGSDPGWRGNLTGELHLDGTAENAQVKTRLRAEGVHRAEFAPAAPMDFDARCDYTWHIMDRAVEKLACDSPLGNGHVRISGALPSGAEAQPSLTFELDRVPVAAGLDALRTVRSEFAAGLEAKGTISGKIAYSGQPTTVETAPDAAKNAKRTKPAPPAGPLSGSLVVDDFQLSGGGLASPLAIGHLTRDPVSGEEALAATTTLVADGSTPLAIFAKLSRKGYELGIHGPASVARARELAHLAGGPHAKLLDALAGEPLTFDLNAQGPWRPAEPSLFHAAPATASAFTSDVVNGTVTLHNANWKSDYLENHLVISQATLRLTPDQVSWDPVVFSYGPVKGSATITVPGECPAPNECVPHFTVQFAQLDASALQAAILGAEEKVTLISTLLSRLHPTAAPVWPHLEGTVKADTLVLGPLTVRSANADLRIDEAGVKIRSLDGQLLGGRLTGSGQLKQPHSEKEKPAYSFEGRFENLNPGMIGPLLDQHWSGGSFSAQGSVELSGYTQADLAASAKGTLHFDWQKGAVAGVPELARFDRWFADAEVANGGIRLGKNEAKRGAVNAAVEASATIGEGAKATFAKGAPATTKH